MYIGICGTHSSGKTKFLSELKSRLEREGCSSTIIGGLPKEAAEKGFPILREHTFETTLWIVSTCVARELEGSLNSDVVLVDRAVPDALGYYLAAMKSRQEKVDHTEWKYLEEIARHHSKRYDLLLKTIVDKSIPIGEEKSRDTDPLYRELVNDVLDDVLDKCSDNWHPLRMDNREKSLDLCVEMAKDKF